MCPQEQDGRQCVGFYRTDVDKLEYIQEMIHGEGDLNKTVKYKALASPFPQIH